MKEFINFVVRIFFINAKWWQVVLFFSLLILNIYLIVGLFLA